MALNSRMIMNDELKRMWKKLALACLKVTYRREKGNYENPQSGHSISGPELENGISQI
jgi:hypothetical protein